MNNLAKLKIFQQILKMGKAKITASGKMVIGMAPGLSLNPFRIPREFRKILDNNIQEFAGMSQLEEAYYAAAKEVLCKKELDPESYIIHLKLLLYMEEYQREIEMKEYDLKDQPIKKCSKGKDFLVHVPGLDEGRPSLQVYDEVKLSRNDGTNATLSQINFIGQKYVKIRSGERFTENYKESDLYNVKFLLSRRTIQCCQHALRSIYEHKLVPAVFPRERVCYNKLSKEPSWFNPNIATNVEQKQAICNIVARTAHPAPYILFGPPGTGKTATLVEAISQIWRMSPSNHILICTPSNAAADEIAKRLLKNIPEEDTYRMYGTSRNWDDVDDEIKPCSNFVNEEIIFLPKELIMLRRVVIVTLMSCARLLALNLRENHFSYVFIDEGGQATEPETLIPLGLMSSDDPSHIGRLQGQLVLAGDPKQLGPSIAMKSIDTLAKSMLERLMEQCSPYMRDETGKYNSKYITKLVKNFRSNDAILQVPNTLFYNGDLVACGKSDDINRAIDCPILPNKRFPMIFHEVLGEESREAHSPSVCNMDEIAVIMKYLEKLIGCNLGGRKLEKKDIGIITPYKLQRIKIEQELERRRWDDVSVGTVEIFQGQERDVVIISTVRSRMYVHKKGYHIGFLSNPKRFNVAVTRAKSLLITVGHPTILLLDDCWKALISHCKRNNAYVGTSQSQKPNYQQRRRLISKKHVWTQSGDSTFQFPDLEDLSTKFRNCKISENLIPKRQPRLPKIDKSFATLLPYEFDSGLTSASNSDSITDSEQQDRASNVSSTDGNSSPFKDAGSSLISNKSDTALLSASRYLVETDSSNSDESTNSSDNDEPENSQSLNLQNMILSHI